MGKLIVLQWIVSTLVRKKMESGSLPRKQFHRSQHRVRRMSWGEGKTAKAETKERHEA